MLEGTDMHVNGKNCPGFKGNVLSFGIKKKKGRKRNPAKSQGCTIQCDGWGQKHNYFPINSFWLSLIKLSAHNVEHVLGIWSLGCHGPWQTLLGPAWDPKYLFTKQRSEFSRNYIIFKTQSKIWTIRGDRPVWFKSSGYIHSYYLYLGFESNCTYFSERHGRVK